jgi:iron complex outermembrane receptor protein
MKTFAPKLLAAAMPLITLTAQVQGQGLEEVLVTAQKREQGLQDVAAAITAMDADTLVKNNIIYMEDLQKFVPGVSIGDSQGQAHIFIRGIGLDQVFTGADPSVAVHLDGAVIAQPQAQLSSFFDLERVEVLRGPQGTLYGRNSTGGSINLISRKPTGEMEGYGRATVGNYNNFIFEGAVSGPLSDAIAGRIAIRTEDRDGFGENILSGEDVDDAQKRSLRAALSFDLGERADLLVSANYHHEDDAAYGFHFLDVQRPEIGLAPPLQGAIVPDDIRDVASDERYSNDREGWGVTATLNLELNEQFSLTSITNTRAFQTQGIHDLDATSVSFFEQRLLFEDEQTSQEFQLHYDNDRLRGLVGLFYFDGRLEGFNRAGANPTAGPLDNLVNFAGTVDIEAWAIFAEYEYDLSTDVTLRLGARYSDEDRQGDALATGIVFPPGGIPNQTGASVDDFSPKLGIDWRINDNVLFYASYSEAFKAGPIQVGTLEPIVEPEEVNSFEVGLKGTYLDGLMTLNLAAFAYDFSNMQVSRTIPAGPDAPPGSEINVFENAGAASNNGIEAEMTWVPTEQLRIMAGFAWLDATFDEYETVDPVFPELGVQDVSGNRLPQAPEFSGNVGAEYQIDLAGGGNVMLQARASYQSKIYFSGLEFDRGAQDAFTVVDARITYSAPGDKYFVNLWGKNITDEDILTTTFPIPLSGGIVATWAPPRTYGITAGYNF